MLTEIKLIATAVALGALVVGGLWLHHSGYAAGIAHCQAVAARAQAKAQAARTTQLAHAQSVQAAITRNGAAKVDESYQATRATVRYITRVVHEHPAPVACVAPPDSVHALQRALSAAQSAAGPLRLAPARAATAADP